MFSLASKFKLSNKIDISWSSKFCSCNCKAKNSSNVLEKTPIGSNDFKIFKILSISFGLQFKFSASSFVVIFRYPLGSMNSRIDKAISLEVFCLNEMLI